MTTIEPGLAMWLDLDEERDRLMNEVDNLRKEKLRLQRRMKAISDLLKAGKPADIRAARHVAAWS